MNTYLAAALTIIILGAGIWFLEKGESQPAAEPTDASAQETLAIPQNQAKTQKPSTPSKTSTQAQTQTAPTTPSASPPPPQATYVNTNEKDIFIVLPKPAQTVTPGITVAGTVRGNWFIQGAMIGEVIAENGDVLARIQIPANGNPMTTEMVQFNAMINVSPNFKGPAAVVIRSDAPPGYPYPDRSVSVPVVVK